MKKTMVRLYNAVARRLVLLAALLLGVFMSVSAKADYAIASQDGSGNITFTPGGMVTPVITGVITCVAAVTALVVLAIGVRWLWRLAHGAK